METWDAIRARRSVRTYQDRPHPRRRARPDLRDLLGIPTDERDAYMLALGFPADRPLVPRTKG